MIPTRTQSISLWEEYHVPSAKRLHVALVERVAVILAQRVQPYTTESINIPLLSAAALLHDVDKAVPKGINEHHPDTAVRLLREHDMAEVADVVRTHSLPAILDQNTSPKSWEEKLLFLADKMVKHEVIGVDERFALWKAETLSKDATREIDACYPKVKELEQQVCTLIGITPHELIALARNEKTSTMSNTLV